MSGSISKVSFSIPQFINYFEKFEELELCNQVLEIRDIRLVMDPFQQAEIRRYSTQKIDEAIDILNILGQAIARVFEVSYTQTPDVVINENLSITVSEYAKIGFISKPIVTRLSDLFRIMIISNIAFVKFNRLYVRGIHADEVEGTDSLQEKFDQIVKTRCQYGKKAIISLDGVEVTFIKPTQTDERTMKLKGCFSIQLDEDPCYKSLESFSMRLQISGKIKALNLTIKNIQRAVQGNVFYDTQMLDKPFLPLGKMVNITIPDAAIEMDEDNTLTVSPQPITFSLIETDLIVNLRDLAIEMEKSQKFSLTINPPYSLLICQISEDEMNDLFIDKNDFEDFNQKLNKIFMKRCLVGYSWILETSNVKYNNQAGKEILVISHNGGNSSIKLSLKQIWGEEIILNICRQSVDDLAKALTTCQKEPVEYLLVRVLYYYLCENIRHPFAYKESDLFRKETAELIEKKIYDEIFKYQIFSHYSNPKSREAALAIFALSPKEFAKFSFDTIEDAILKNIFVTLEEIAKKESETNEFHTKCLNIANKEYQRVSTPRNTPRSARTPRSVQMNTTTPGSLEALPPLSITSLTIPESKFVKSNPATTPLA